MSFRREVCATKFAKPIISRRSNVARVAAQFAV